MTEQAHQVPDVDTLAHPHAPTTLADSGLSIDLVTQLALKTLHFAGELTGTEWAARLGLPFQVIEPAIDQIKSQYHCEIVGGTLVGNASFRYRITDQGRVRAAMFLRQNQYVGIAPVPLSAYWDYMREFEQRGRAKISPARVREVLAHLVLTDRVLDQLGPAVTAGHSLFVYGPPGNGKTVIAQTLARLLHGHIAIPHAIEVEGQIVRVFDPVLHEAVPLPPPVEALDAGHGPDRRWVPCRRPSVTVGGELLLDALDLAYSQSAGFYRAPVQVAANGGVLVIDDFGRQRCSPDELLNRWIGPLEMRVDYLTLQSGQRIEVPFQVLVAFATNLRPKELVDEAFLRRIHFKVFAESPSVLDFHRIFEKYCGQQQVEFDAALVEDLLQNFYHPRQIPLRGCHPRDLIDQALTMADYLGEPRRLTPELLRSACVSYFIDDQEPLTEYA